MINYTELVFNQLSSSDKLAIQLMSPDRLFMTLMPSVLLLQMYPNPAKLERLDALCLNIVTLKVERLAAVILAYAKGELKPLPYAVIKVKSPKFEHYFNGDFEDRKIELQDMCLNTLNLLVSLESKHDYLLFELYYIANTMYDEALANTELTLDQKESTWRILKTVTNRLNNQFLCFTMLPGESCEEHIKF